MSAAIAVGGIRKSEKFACEVNMDNESGAHEKSLSSRIAEKIRQDFVLSGFEILPSMKSLSVRYRVSRRTVLSATRKLREEGVLDFRQGTPVRTLPDRRKSEFRHDPETRLSSREKLYRIILSRITEGVYRAGDPLPKRRALALEHLVSTSTVSSVYHRLIAENIAKKRGKRFVVGRRTRVENGSSNWISPFIVVLVSKWSEWLNIGQSSRTNRFVEEFLRESRTHGIRVFLASANGALEGRGEMQLEELHEYIRQNREHYLGCLAGITHREYPPWKSLIRSLLEYQRPVVWFDRYDEGAKGISSPLFTRCRFSEENGVYRALEYLHFRGHRSVVYSYQNTIDWQKNRMDILARQAEEFSPPMEVYGYLFPTGDVWLNPSDSERISGIVEKAMRVENPVVQKAFEYIESQRSSILRHFPLPPNLRRMLPHAVQPVVALASAKSNERSDSEDMHIRAVWSVTDILPLLTDERFTALIVPNDQLATEEYVPYFKLLGLRLPADFSMVSFDCREPSVFVPPTTVDFGFGGLGYAAFHVLLGDIPTGRSARGIISSRAVVVDRGTVGAPRTHKHVTKYQAKPRR